MRHRACVFRPSTGTPAPSISSLNYDQGDVAGGGQSIIITGTNLSSASAVSFGGTSATITGNTSTTVTVTLPAKTAGATTVSVTTPGGTSGTLAFEFWAPSTDGTCTQLNDSVSNSYSATGDGSWAARVGSTLVSGTAGTPTASSGKPSFDGSTANGLETPLAYTLTNSGAATGTFAAIFTSNAASAPAGSPFNDRAIVSKTGDGTMGIGFNTSGIRGYVFTGTYQEATATCATGGLHLGIMRFANASHVGAKVDGGAWSTTTFGGSISYSNTVCLLGLGWDYSVSKFNGTISAFVAFSSSVSDATATKIYKWAQQRFGVT